VLHLSTKASLHAVRAAKSSAPANGARITCEVSPHHLLLTHDDVVRPGIDTPHSLGVHSQWAQLTPKGGALIHVARYGKATEAELEERYRTREQVRRVQSRRRDENRAVPPRDDAETARLRDEVKQLKERLQVIERITVEKENSLEREIERLRDRP